MTIEQCFELKKEARISFIDKSIVRKLPKEERDSAKTRATEIASNYVGVDVAALSILAYAAEQSRFGEFAEKLEEHYGKSLIYVHPEKRKFSETLGIVRANNFFVQCYSDLGVKPQR